MPNLTKAPFLLIFVFHCIFLNAQKSQKDSIDTYLNSIKNLVKTKDFYKEEFLDIEFLNTKKEQVEGKEKVHSLLKLYTANVYRSDDSASSFNDQALELSEHIQFNEGILKAKYNNAYLLFVKGNFDDSMKMLRGIQKVVSITNHPHVHGDVATLKSYIYTERGEYDKALETGLKLLDNAEKTKSDYLLMKASSALSHYYLRIEHFSKSLSYCLKGLHYIIKLKKTEYFYPKIDEIARMTAKLNDPKGALKVYDFFIDIQSKIPPPGDYIQSSVYMNMSNVYMSIKDFNMAQYYLTKAMEMVTKNKYRFRIPRALTLQAELFLKTKDTANALLNYERSIDAAEQIEAFDLIKQNSAILNDLYISTHQLSKAYEYRALSRAISDSLFTNEKEQKILLLETKRNIKEVIQEKKILELENEAQNEKFNSIVLVLALLFIISNLAIYSYIKVRHKNNLLINRTIELTEIRLKMQKKLAGYIKIEHNGTNDDIGANCNKGQTPIDEDVKDIIMIKLEKLEKETFFLDPNCSLYLLSEQLKTNPKYLSQVINQEKKSNFNNYINKLRINYLLPKLLNDIDYRNSKLSYIAVSLGYNNLNTFNSAFKKRIGILPSKFISELNNSFKLKENLG